MSTPFALTAANTFMYYHERDNTELYAQHLTLYKRFIDDIFVTWDKTQEILFEFLSAMNTDDEHIKLTYKISDCKILFLDLLLFKDSTCQPLQYSTFQKPLSICTYLLNHFTPPATKRHSLKANLYGMLEIPPGFVIH